MNGPGSGLICRSVLASMAECAYRTVSSLLPSPPSALCCVVAACPATSMRTSNDAREHRHGVGSRTGSQQRIVHQVREFPPFQQSHSNVSVSRRCLELWHAMLCSPSVLFAHLLYELIMSLPLPSLSPPKVLMSWTRLQRLVKLVKTFESRRKARNNIRKISTKVGNVGIFRIIIVYLYMTTMAIQQDLKSNSRALLRARLSKIGKRFWSTHQDFRRGRLMMSSYRRWANKTLVEHNHLTSSGVKNIGLVQLI